MKKHVLICVGVFAFVLQSAHAQNTVIYGTYDDWNDPNWSGNGGYTVEANSAFNYGNITVNGIGNTTAAGGTSHCWFAPSQSRSSLVSLEWTYN